jgi:hypothetical protein
LSHRPSNAFALCRRVLLSSARMDGAVHVLASTPFRRSFTGNLMNGPDSSFFDTAAVGPGSPTRWRPTIAAGDAA